MEEFLYFLLHLNNHRYHRNYATKTVQQPILNFFHLFRNPTPSSSDLPKWQPAKNIPVSYYRIGNANFPGKSLFGNENGGIFQDRADFWYRIGAHLPARDTEKVVNRDEL